mmetsp:Transcript_31336/g.72131  ORF Transcript_31336/g.72131 Transcript_31336/m.72131 type:complete len:262 (-) Transcript_31336:155-940(-)
MRWKWGWFLGVLIQIGHVLRKDLTITIGSILAGLLGVGRLGRLVGGCSRRLGCGATRGSGRGRRTSGGGFLGTSSVFRRGLLLLKVLVARVGLEFRHVNEIVDSTFDIRHRRLIGSKTPFIIHNKLEGMFASLEIMNIGKVISRSMHGNLSTPSIEGSRNVHLSSSVLPTKDRGNGVIVQPIHTMLLFGIHGSFRHLSRIVAFWISIRTGCRLPRSSRIGTAAGTVPTTVRHGTTLSHDAWIPTTSRTIQRLLIPHILLQL